MAGTYNGSVELGERIRRRRLELDLHQSEVAERLGVDQSSVSKWERGKAPAPEHFSAIADFLDVSRGEVARILYDTSAGVTDEAGLRIAALEAEVAELRQAFAEFRQDTGPDVAADAHKTRPSRRRAP